ncbi:site-specific recombinase [Glaciimonas soli]|uniref:Preprotein translocase subunit TatB n=1 Tax=Glaciimonas soli TaxID=2590999 RepID=A0A843YQ56_9BURK|nr:site-specific recombinase [Glaciimonas soli]MQQ99520.1 preprotein translocase subunit TatB [Glaciimonas soli]
MKIFLLRLRVMWQRFRNGDRYQRKQHIHYAAQVESLMRRANPFATWQERANWVVDIAEWVRHEATVSLLEDDAWRRVKQQRVLFVLDWLDTHKDVRRIVQTTLQKTLREAAGPELFCATGLPAEPAFFSELSEHIFKHVLPKPPSEPDLSVLFTAMFPHPDDVDWLLELDANTLSRIWKLTSDVNISHVYLQQIDEALLYLMTVVLADGLSKAFRDRLDPKMPLQSTPFSVLRRELEKYLQHRGNAPSTQAALRSVRMLIAVCQAQTDRIYAHLDEYGVSVSLVYRVERMRAHLNRITHLIDLRAAATAQSAAFVADDVLVLSLPEFDDITIATKQSNPMAGQIQMLLVDFIVAHHHRASIRGLIGRSFSLLARKMVERNADHGEHYIARDNAEYRSMLKAASRGGVLTAFTVLGKTLLSSVGFARFFEGIFASLNYAVSFLAISAIGGALATKQPAVTAPALAAKMEQLDTIEGLRGLLVEIAQILRSQAAAVLGNLMAVVPTMLAISLVMTFIFHAPVMDAQHANDTIQGLSIIGLTPFFAALTGVLLWLSSLASGFADNWFALRRLREALSHQRRLVYILGAVRAERWATWLDRNVALIVGNISLGFLLGMSPVIAQFFGLHLDVRHVTLATGSLTAAASSLGWQSLLTPQFWLAVCGIASIGLLNVGVSFACALTLALRARAVPPRIRRVVFRAVLRRFTTSPRFFIFPDAPSTASAATVVDAAPIESTQDEIVIEKKHH